MVTLTLKVPESLAARLEVAARQRGAGKSALVREAIVAYLDQAPESRAGSFLDAARDLRFACIPSLLLLSLCLNSRRPG